MTYPVTRALSKVTAHYKDSRRPSHKGIDIAPRVPGTKLPLYAVDDGYVSHVNIGGWAAGKNVAITLDGDGSIWWYGHMSRIDVNLGDRVQNGEHATQLGLMGNTGFAFGVHVCLKRFARGILDNVTNPWPYLARLGDPRRVKAAVPAPAPVKPTPHVPPAPPASRGVVVGSKLRLSGWVGYTDHTLSRRMPGGNLSGVFEVVGIRSGAYKVKGHGRTAWLHGSAKAGLI